MEKIKIRNKQYNIEKAISKEEKVKGLQDIEQLPEDEGILFIFDPPEDVQFWMKGVKIPLDIVFINEDQEVVKVKKGKPNNDTLIKVDSIAYVLEVNANSGIKVGDELDLEEDLPVMKVLAQDGSTQMDLWGGERIVSRRETKILIKKAKKANDSLQDSDYKALGKYMFKVLDRQDNREPEYVQRKD